MCVCYSFHTNQISAYIGMQRIEEAKLVTAGRDFTPNFAIKPNSVWFINAQIFWTSSKVYFNLMSLNGKFQGWFIRG